MTEGGPETPPQAMPPDAIPPAVTPPSSAALQAELEQARTLAEEYLNGWRRAKADYLNLKRETDERTVQLSNFARAELLLQLLPVYNDLQLAFRQLPAEPAAREWAVGLANISSQFERTMETLGVVTIPTVGEPFNPKRHEAVEAVTREGAKSNTIVEEVAPGYTLHGQVLLPAKVKVAK